MCLLYYCYYIFVKKILGYEGFGFGFLKMYCVVVEVLVFNDFVVNVFRKVVEFYVDIEFIFIEFGR